MALSESAQALWDAIPSASEGGRVACVERGAAYNAQVADPTAIDASEKDGLIQDIMDAADCDEWNARKVANSLIRALRYDVKLARRGVAKVAEQLRLVQIIREQHDPWVLKHKAMLQARYLVGEDKRKAQPREERGPRRADFTDSQWRRLNPLMRQSVIMAETGDADAADDPNYGCKGA